MLSVPSQHPGQQHPQQIMPPQMQQPGMMLHPQTPQQNRHISPMNVRPTPQHQIQIPGGPSPHPQAPYYAAGPRPSPMAPGPVPPSAKRYKQTPAPHPAAAAAQAAALGVGGDPAMTIDEEEDTSRGDILDHYSPREIATTRYKQNHEWMEEVLGSPYAISQIKPVDLGLGLMGELESVTKGLLDPPTANASLKSSKSDSSKPARSQKEVLEELKPRVMDKIAEMEAEMARMKAEHAQRLTKIKANSIFRDAELDLRGGLGLETLLPGLQPPRPVEGDSDTESPAPISPSLPRRPVEEIVRSLETTAGKKIVPATNVIKYDIPEEEIVKMGGVVAPPPGQNLNHQQHIDTEMQDGHVNTLEDDAAFKLDIPTPPTGSPTAETPGMLAHPDTDTAAGLLDEFQQRSEETGGMEDTIMADFMNVDDITSKPNTPHQNLDLSGMGSAGDAGTGAGGAGDEMFMIPSMEGTPGDMGLDLGGAGQ